MANNMITSRFRLNLWTRWLGTFVGFPLAGVVARAVAGPTSSTSAALVGGLVGGAALGAVQISIGGIGGGDRAHRVRWLGATAAGFALGLAAGATAVRFRTDPASLAVMGVVTGAVVGSAQAVAIPMARIDRALWALANPALWAAGWLVTSQVIVDTDRHHAVFGSSGALLVCAVTGVLQVRRQARGPSTQPAPAATAVRSAVAS